LPSIRPEQPGDIAAVHRVNADAFGRPNEADLVDALRANGKAILSLVADLDGLVVGHVFFTEMLVEPGFAPRVIALGPLAVLPPYQRQGIGSALVRQGIEDCRSLRYDLLLLLGEPEYYGRFGFVNAPELGLRLSDHMTERATNAFQVIELKPGSAGNAIVRYADKFRVYT
jgi:putative acetyltransferase